MRSEVLSRALGMRWKLYGARNVSKRWYVSMLCSLIREFLEQDCQLGLAFGARLIWLLSENIKDIF